ncbi:CynX/NimT family MFS transporter [Pseudonocardia acaciae]|uniref:CynX/NimT family MFS transporter n=1 Tax=Pseudonocardia acaciae TaxID=551276 RepID=UPI0007E8E4E8|nr:MFS transporter [Pseudonocardia acaciae]
MARGVPSTDRPEYPTHRWATLLGIVLIAVNMRAAIAATGPLVPDIRADLGLSRAAVSLLTTLPLLCFGLLATGAAALGRRIGSERALLLAMLGVAAGSLLRVTPATAWLLLGTALIGAAVAVVNVLLPTVVKQHFGRRASAVTGVYTAALIAGAATASGLSAPLARLDGLGWRGALLVAGAPALVAAVVWLPRLRGTHLPPKRVRISVLRSRVTWALAVFMGMQSLLFFAMTAWLPSLLRDAGVSAYRAGVALALFNLLGVVGSLVVPAVAARRASQLPVAFAVCLAWAVALAGLNFAPGYYLVWSVLSGLAQGAALSLTLTLIVLRAPDADTARGLSGTVQGIGYLLAATGPLAMGTLRDATPGWGVPLLALGLATAVMAASSPWSAGRGQVR